MGNNSSQDKQEQHQWQLQQWGEALLKDQENPAPPANPTYPHNDVEDDMPGIGGSLSDGGGTGADDEGTTETTNYYGDYSEPKPPATTGDLGDNGGTTLSGATIGQNYTGPYISGGKLQSSVEFGEAEALSLLDYFSRLHDTAYAHWPDRRHRYAADLIYHDEVKKLVGMYPAIASRAVKYANIASATTSGPFAFMKDHNPFGLSKVKKEILEYFDRDPAFHYYQGKFFKKENKPAKAKWKSKIYVESQPREQPKHKMQAKQTSERTLINKQAERFMNHQVRIAAQKKNKKKKKKKINENLKEGMKRLKSFPPRFT